MPNARPGQWLRGRGSISMIFQLAAEQRRGETPTNRVSARIFGIMPSAKRHVWTLRKISEIFSASRI